VAALGRWRYDHAELDWQLHMEHLVAAGQVVLVACQVDRCVYPEQETQVQRNCLDIGISRLIGHYSMVDKKYNYNLIIES